MCVCVIIDLLLWELCINRLQEELLLVYGTVAFK